MKDMERVKRIKKRLDSRVLPLKGVNGSAIKKAEGNYYLAVYVSKPGNELKRTIPDEIEGTEVRIEEIGDTKLL